jgi:hypothetical protein
MAVLRSVRTTEFATAERRFDSLRWPALAVWLGIPVIGFAAQPIAGRIVWTVAVAALPLFIVLIGYHRWRRICPLAWVNQIPARLGRAGTLRMPVWLEQHYYYISLGGFVLGLWLRLTWTNSDGVAIALFFTGLSVLALVAGALTTGISWCNYLCPVSFIEKVYTEPIGLRQTQNSQCTTCTACKKACPDINEENAYWKDIDLPSKRTAYFAYPGLICGFYLYYFLQSGTWDYYFGGSWTDQPGVIWHAFLPGQDAATAGFFFLPWIPRALAALVTLLTCAAVSWLAFTVLVERNLVKPWQWGDPPPADPHDVILVHQTYSQSRERAHSDVLQIYRDSVRQAMAEHERIVHKRRRPGCWRDCRLPRPKNNSNCSDICAHSSQSSSGVSTPAVRWVRMPSSAFKPGMGSHQRSTIRCWTSCAVARRAPAKPLKRCSVGFARSRPHCRFWSSKNRQPWTSWRSYCVVSTIERASASWRCCPTRPSGWFWPAEGPSRGRSKRSCAQTCRTVSHTFARLR